MRRIRELLAVVTVVAACAGCGPPPPVIALPDPHALDRWPYGAAASIRTPTRWRTPLRGELLALQGDSVHVLTPEGPVAVACRDVTEIRLRADRYGQLKAPSLFFARGSQKPNRPLRAQWQKLTPFARFPGGLPDSLDLWTLRLPPR